MTSLPEVDYLKGFLVLIVGSAVGFGIVYAWNRTIGPKIDATVGSL